jgi:predicted Zn-dependent protease
MQQMSRNDDPRFEKLCAAFKLMKEKEFDGAANLLYELIDEYPDFPQGYRHLGEIFGEQGKTEQAIIYLRKAVELAPTSKLSSLMLFHMLWDTEEYQSALNEIKRFTEAGGKCEDYQEIVEELKAKKMIDDDLNWLSNS